MRPLSIALAEDSRTAALMMTDIITDLGYSIDYIYDSGEKLVEDLENATYDVLLADIELKGEMNGFQAIKEFKKKKPLTPFFYVTAHDDIHTLQTAAKTNPWGFFSKPLDKMSIRNTLELILNNKNILEKVVNNSQEKDRRIEQLEKEIEMMKMHNNELSMTNEHLISATWRERDLKKELADSKQIIEEQHGQITDSINYAHRIQKALVTNEDVLASYFRHSFLFFKAKDVVSGDFPWSFVKQDYIYFAAVDCTGHGVPGAMLATIGTLLLNDIVNDEGIKTTDEILNKLHHAIIDTLNQNNVEGSPNDGMDIAICRWNKTSHELQFSGAHRPLYVINSDGVQKYRGCPYPIGGTQYRKRKPFKKHDTTLKPGDSFFIFSDGVPDQFGGGDDDKFGNKRIETIISDGLQKGISFQEIKSNLGNSVENWMNAENAPQTDDMLLICGQV